MTGDKLIFPAPSEPLEVAREIIHDNYSNAGRRALVRHRGQFLNWTGTHWRTTEDASIRALLYSALADVEYEKKGDDGKSVRVPWNPNRRNVSDVIDAMQALVHMPGDVESPGWMPGADQDLLAHDPREIIAVDNGLLDVRTRELLDHTPDFFTRTAVPFDYTPDASTPTVWLGFLASIWDGDAEAVAALQEWFGYVLSGRTDMQKIFLLIGPTRSGKGTIARVLAALIGRRNVAGPTLASLATNFGLSPLLDKPLALVSDARLGGHDAHQVVERLLSISGEDLLTVDRKYQEPWSGKLPARFTILSNELPSFGDASGAISNRMVVLTMRRSFLGREDTALTGRLLAELPAILTWSLEGLDRLNRHGTFTVPKSSKDSTTMLQDLTSPMAAFLRQECIRADGALVRTERLYAAWRNWAEDNGRGVTSVQKFGRDLQAAAPEVRRSVRKRDGATFYRDYEGIRLRTQQDSEDDDQEDAPRDNNGKNTGTLGTLDNNRRSDPESGDQQKGHSEIGTGTPADRPQPVVPEPNGHAETDNHRSNGVVPNVPEQTPLLSLVSGPLCRSCGTRMTLDADLAAGIHAACAEPKRQTARQWLEGHVHTLIANGDTEAASSAVYAAGRAAGFSIDSLRQAARKSDLIAPTAARAGGTIWKLGAGGDNQIISCPQWLVSWLSGRGWVRAADVFAAGADAGYGRQSVKSAGLAEHILKRGASVATEWSLDPNYNIEVA